MSEDIFNKRLKSERGGLFTEDGESVTLFIPGVADYVVKLWNERIGTADDPIETFVRIDNPRFRGYAYAQYTTLCQKHVSAELENGNVWQYEANTVRPITADELEKVPRVLREKYGAGGE